MINFNKLETQPDREEVLYLNNPVLVDPTLCDIPEHVPEDGTFRIYIPLDLSPSEILRRLRFVIRQYGEANEENEFSFSNDVNQIIRQIEIYDSILYSKTKEHCTNLVKDFIEELERIPDGCAECFPFDAIDELKQDWGISDID